MIIKGKSRSGPRQLGNYLSEQGANEKIKVFEIRGTAARNPRDAIFEMDAYALGTNCEKPLYHGFINPEPPYFLTPEQLTEAVDALEEKLGLDGNARVVLVHEKFDRQGRYRQHIHIVWSRIDLDRMVAVSDSFNYRKHEEVARELERRFDHPRVQGAHAERDGDRPERTPSQAERRQEERTGITGKQVKAEVTEAFRASDGPEAFKAALEERGYILAQGDRRDFVIVDRAGGIHSLARRIEGMKAAELREFMAPLDRESLPDIQRAREIVQERKRPMEEAHDQALLEKAYGRGDDYVSQTQAAQKDFRRRQEELDDGSLRPQAPGTQSASENLPGTENDVHKMENSLDTQELTREAIKREPWHAVYLRLPENPDPALLWEAHCTAEYCYEAALDRATNPDWRNRASRAYEPREVECGRRADAAEHAKVALERLEELERLDPSLERMSAHEARSEDEERIAQVIEDSDRRRHSEAERGEAASGRKDEAGISDKFANTEMTEAQQQRMERLLNVEVGERAHSSERDDLEPDRQREAPDGGRTRSR